MAKSALQKLQNHYARYNTLDQMIEGLNYIEQKLYTDALIIFDKLVLESTGMGSIYKDALRNKGFCLYMLGKFPEALDCYNKLSAVNPNMKEWRYMAACLYEISKYSEALEPCDKGLKLNSTDPLCLSVKAKCLSKLDQNEEAIEYYDKHFMLTGSVFSLMHKAICMMLLKRYDAALDEVESALALDPEQVETLHIKIHCLCYLAQYEKALACCEEAVVLDSGDENHQRVLYYKILALNKLARYDEAIACQNNQKALSMKGFVDDDALIHKASTLNRLGSS